MDVRQIKIFNGSEWIDLLNLGPGKGSKSVIQFTDSLEVSNIALGRNAFSGGEASQALNTRSFAFGNKVISCANSAVAFGQVVINYGPGSLITGSANINGSTPTKTANDSTLKITIKDLSGTTLKERECVLKSSNDFNAQYSLMYGYGNENTGRESLVGGRTNENKGYYNIVGGLLNTLKTNSGCSFVIGHNNELESNITGGHSATIITGRNNIVKSLGSAVFGQSNEVDHKINDTDKKGFGWSLVAGSQNIVKHDHAFILGKGLQTYAYGQTIVGQYNNPLRYKEEDAIFIVGNGDIDITSGTITRKNAFQVLKKGGFVSSGDGILEGNLKIKNSKISLLKDNNSIFDISYAADTGLQQVFQENKMTFGLKGGANLQLVVDQNGDSSVELFGSSGEKDSSFYAKNIYGTNVVRARNDHNSGYLYPGRLTLVSKNAELNSAGSVSYNYKTVNLCSLYWGITANPGAIKGMMVIFPQDPIESSVMGGFRISLNKFYVNGTIDTSFEDGYCEILVSGFRNQINKKMQNGTAIVLGSLQDAAKRDITVRVANLANGRAPCIILGDENTNWGSWSNVSVDAFGASSLLNQSWSIDFVTSIGASGVVSKYGIFSNQESYWGKIKTYFGEEDVTVNATGEYELPEGHAKDETCLIMSAPIQKNALDALKDPVSKYDLIRYKDLYDEGHKEYLKTNKVRIGEQNYSVEIVDSDLEGADLEPEAGVIKLVLMRHTVVS